MVTPFPDTSCVSLHVDGLCIHLSPEEVRAHKNGMEFVSNRTFPSFLVMDMEIAVPGHEQRVTCSGVVVACDPLPGVDRHRVTVLFLGLPSDPAPA